MFGFFRPHFLPLQMFEYVSFSAGIECTEQKLAPLAQEGKADTAFS